MPWKAVEFKSAAGQKLFSKYGVRGIPRLVIIGPQGVVNDNAVSLVAANPTGEGFPWEGQKPKYACCTIA